MLIYQSLACLSGFELCRMPERSPLELPVGDTDRQTVGCEAQSLYMWVYTVISFCCGLKCHLIPALVSALNLHKRLWPSKYTLTKGQFLYQDTIYTLCFVTIQLNYTSVFIPERSQLTSRQWISLSLAPFSPLSLQDRLL